MPRKVVAIQSLLMRTFVPAVVAMAVIMATLVYNRLYGTILDGFDRKLVITSALTGALIDPVDHEKLVALSQTGFDGASAERLAEYLRNVLPMQKIRSELKLTYLYTQVFGGGQDVVYILDSNVDDDHSLLGSEDDLPDDTLADLQAAIMAGRVHVAPIEYQEQWGLLKSATSPMRASDGRITAMAGADVNISVIRVATQNALFASTLIGLVSLVICALAALVIVSRVARPIERLKFDALRIAAGDQALPGIGVGPRETMKMRDALTHIVIQMRAKLAAAQDADAHLEQQRSEQILQDALMSDGASPVTLVDNDAVLIIWLGSADKGLDNLLQRRAMMALAHRIEQAPALGAAWELICGSSGPILVLDRQARSLRVIGEGEVPIRSGGEMGSHLRLLPGEQFTLRGDEELSLTEGNIRLSWWAGA